MEGNLLEINENVVMKGYNDVCEGKGDFKENIQMVNDGTRNWLELCKAADEDERRQLDIKLLKLKAEREALEMEKIRLEMSSRKFNNVKDTLIEVGKFAAPIATAMLSIGGGLGLLALKHHNLKDSMLYNSQLQSQGYLGINDQKLVDVSINDFKSVK